MNGKPGMTDWSRRRALHMLATTTVLGLAGCNTDSLGDTDEAVSHPVTEYAVEKVRTSATKWLFDTGETEASTDDFGSLPYKHVTDESDVSRLRFADNRAARRLASYVRETDFESRSVYVYQHEVGACYDLRLVSVRRQPADLHVSFCRDLKSASVDCRSDRTDVTGFAIRLPFPGDSITSIGSGYGSSCDRTSRLASAGGNRTEAGTDDS